MQFVGKKKVFFPSFADKGTKRIWQYACLRCSTMWIDPQNWDNTSELFWINIIVHCNRRVCFFTSRLIRFESPCQEVMSAIYPAFFLLFDSNTVMTPLFPIAISLWFLNSRNPNDTFVTCTLNGAYYGNVKAFLQKRSRNIAPALSY